MKLCRSIFCCPAFAMSINFHLEKPSQHTMHVETKIARTASNPHPQEWKQLWQPFLPGARLFRAHITFSAFQLINPLWTRKVTNYMKKFWRYFNCSWRWEEGGVVESFCDLNRTRRSCKSCKCTYENPLWWTCTWFRTTWRNVFPASAINYSPPLPPAFTMKNLLESPHENFKIISKVLWSFSTR